MGISHGLVVTNYHTFRDALSRSRGEVGASVTHPLTGRSWEGRVIAADPVADLLLIAVPDGDLDWVQLSGSSPTPGLPCALFGYPNAGPLQTITGQFNHNDYIGEGGMRFWEVSIPGISGDSGGGMFASNGCLSGVICRTDGQTSVVIDVADVVRICEKAGIPPRKPEQPAQEQKLVEVQAKEDDNIVADRIAELVMQRLNERVDKLLESK